MKERKNRLRQGLALLLAIMLIGMGMNFTAMTVSAEEADDEIVMVDAGYLDEYIIQKGGSPSSYQSEASQSVSRAATADVEGAKTAIIQAIRDRKETLNISAYNIPSTDMAELSVSIINYNPDLFYAGISKWGYSPSTQCVTTVYFRYSDMRNKVSSMHTMRH